MDKIEDPDEKTPEVEEEESEDKSEVSEPTPDFDEDEIMFSS